VIELLSDQRCVACDACVKVCPTNVFDAVDDAPPIIARWCAVVRMVRSKSVSWPVGG